VALVQILSLYTTGVVETTVVHQKSNTSTVLSSLESDDDEPTFYDKVMRILSMIETVITLVIPPILIVIMNGFIIHGLFQFNRKFKQRSSSSPPLISDTERINEQINIKVNVFTITTR
jgi:hypothetical protein